MITDYRIPPSGLMSADESLANELNTFFTCFEVTSSNANANSTSTNNTNGAIGTANGACAEPTIEQCPLIITESDVRRAFKRVPDGICGRVLKACSEQLAPGNNLLLNVSKIKELIVDCSKKQEQHYQPVRINGPTVERVESFRYFGVHISQDLSWSRHTNSLAKKAGQRLYHLRGLRDFRLPSKVLWNFYTCTIEIILMGNITVWFGNSTKRTDKHSRGWWIQQSASLIWNFLTCRLSITSNAKPRSGKHFRSLKTNTERLKRSFIPQAIRALTKPFHCELYRLMRDPVQSPNVPASKYVKVSSI
ncbi:hypothetical protein P4O66_003210 [Electrophorus voltai]|uniref:Alkylated DNA repair protein AlkB homologue 8 N-terminal domain-containing protein n=1 Tax=Electrophorus voltai TaxID=2609070 RepID=A0AAD8YT49_9TELE|nr:hypothetical protein P4O66_003210 [Electrophorus voltai]